MNSAQIKAMVEDEFEELVEIRRDLHMHPELSEHEERTERRYALSLISWAYHTRPALPGTA